LARFIEVDLYEAASEEALRCANSIEQRSCYWSASHNTMPPSVNRINRNGVLLSTMRQTWNDT